MHVSINSFVQESFITADYLKLNKMENPKQSNMQQ